MPNKQMPPLFPDGLDVEKLLAARAGLKNSGLISHEGDGAIMQVPTSSDTEVIDPSAVRYNAEADQFEGSYMDGWRTLGGGGIQWKNGVATDGVYPSTVGNGYFVDTRTQEATVKLPQPSAVGASVSFCDLWGRASIFSIAIDGDGKKVYGSTDQTLVQQDYAAFTLTWTGEDQGWVITSGVNLNNGATYRRSRFYTTLTADATIVSTGTTPDLADVYVNGSHIPDAHYNIQSDGYHFDFVLRSGAEVEIIEYVPVNAGGGGADEVYAFYGSSTVGKGASAVNTTSGRSVQRILNDIKFVFVESFGAVGDGVTDDSDAIQAAVNFAIANQYSKVIGCQKYAISKTITNTSAGSYGLAIELGQVFAHANFPDHTNYWDAKPMFLLGDDTSNHTGMRIVINVLDGGKKAHGIQAYGYGWSLSVIDIGLAQNCIFVIHSGEQKWPNASNEIYGSFWKDNVLGAYLANNTSGNTTNPTIVEGWKWNVKFIAANAWGGVWFKSAGHYGQIRGDWDFNGYATAVLVLTDGTGLDKIAGQTQLKLTNGTKEYEFLFYFVYQGMTCIVIGADENLGVYNNGRGGIEWATTDTISCTTITGVALKYGQIQVTGDNGSETNFFDIWHDFQASAFAKLQVMPGYMSQIIGGNIHTTNIQMQNSFNGIGFRMQGFGVSNSGSTLAFYDFTHSDIPWANITPTFVNFQKRLYMQDHTYEGIPILVPLAAAAEGDDSYTSAFTLFDASSDKYADEGTMWHIDMKSNYAGCYGSFKVFIKGVTPSVIDARQDPAWKFVIDPAEDGSATVVVKILQRAQPIINMMFNIRRV